MDAVWFTTEFSAVGLCGNEGGFDEDESVAVVVLVLFIAELDDSAVFTSVMSVLKQVFKTISLPDVPPAPALSHGFGGEAIT